MELITSLLDILLHLDRHLGEIIRDFGVWTYLILFVIVFCETGLVVTPILPGDSLLFAVGGRASSAGNARDGLTANTSTARTNSTSATGPRPS